MKKTLLAFCSFLLFMSYSNATHIVGGSLTYEHLGGASYRILLKLYRDCTPTTTPTPVQLQNTAPVDFYYGSTGAFYQRVTLTRVQYDPISPNLDTCVADPGICVQEGLFTAIVNNLPPIPGGYHMYFETCCRNGSVQNIQNPNQQGIGGEGFYCKISDNTQLLTNSSPQWVNPPPVFVCQGQNIGFDHSATDADGDSLVYSFYTPFGDIDYAQFNANNHLLTFSGGVPNNMVNVVWLSNFSANNPLDVSGVTSLTVTGGIINGTPPNLGQYVAGVRCDEYRNGVLIGSIYRDFQFNVVVCPPPVVAAIGPISGCNNTTIQLQNNTTGGATSYNWNFGDASPNSSATNPTHTWPGIGSYTVTLIADPGSNCADTAYQTFTVAFSTADFNAVDSVCVTSPVFFTDNSGGSAGNSINSWNWNFGDGFTSGVPNPTHTYNTGGLYTVTLIINSTQGCRDTIQKQIFVQGLPSANAGPDTTACNNNPLVSLNGVVANCSGGLWLNTNGTYNPNNSTLITDYTPTAAEVAAGSIDIVLSTTGNGLCPTAVDTIHITFIDGPLVNAGTDIQVCQDTSSVPLSGSVQFAGGGVWSTNGSGSFADSTDLTTLYYPSPADTSAGSIMIFLTATNVGNCITTTDTVLLSFYSPPTVSIMNNDTSCSGDPIPLLVNVSTGSGVWTTLGNGTFSPDSSANSYYIPGSNDISSGSVTLVFVSTNNGGCQAVRDTLDLSIIPSPVPAFSFTEPCFGGTSTFTDFSTAVGGIAGWEWDFGDGSPIDNAQNPAHVYGTEGTNNVTLIVTSTNGCKDTLTQAVDVHYLPDPGFFSPNPCLNGGTDFTDTSSVVGSTIVSWFWDFGDGTTDTVQNPTHTYPAAGTYAVTLIVQSAYGCYDTLVQNTTVLPGPNADFLMSDDAVNQYQQVIFTDASTPAGSIVSWQWDFGDGSAFDFNQNTSHGYDSSGVYIVTLVVTDNNGCVDTARNDIIVFMPPLVPTGFSPGNGDGINDVLYVLGGPFKDLQFRIYNEWGQLIFESFSQSHGWDGTYKQAPQPLGVYVYVVSAITEDDILHEISGDVTLLR